MAIIDSIFLQALTKELSDKLVGAKIERIWQPVRGSIIMSLFKGKRFNLYIGSSANIPRIHCSPFTYDYPGEPPAFCLLLRKYLMNTTILEVSQPRRDRIVTLKFSVHAAFGESKSQYLTVELLGRTANAILTDSEGMIRDCLYRVGTVDKPRALLPNVQYSLPPLQAKSDLFAVDGNDILRVLQNGSGGSTLDQFLVRSFMGLSPIVARELSFVAYGDTSPQLASVLARDGGEMITEKLLALRELDPEPYVVLDPSGTPFEFSYMPILQYGSKYRLNRANNFSELLYEFCKKRDEEEKRLARGRQLIKVAKTARDRVARRLAAQNEELRATNNREYLRQSGEIIKANMYHMKKGDKVLIAPDFFDHCGREREIKLDPLKTPNQNAVTYYKEYKRLQSANKHLTECVAAGKEELDYLDSILEELTRAETTVDIAEIRDELCDGGYMTKQEPSRKMKRAYSGPMHYCSTTGRFIDVGRTNIQNDTITFKQAAKTDMWLHARNYHGSHVIILTRGGCEVDEQSVQEAAVLAAYYSDGRCAGHVPVDYTLVKYVKKPKGAKPGMVTYTEYKTITVTPDFEFVNSLRVKKFGDWLDDLES